MSNSKKERCYTLHNAAHKGDIQQLRKFIRYKHDVNRRFETLTMSKGLLVETIAQHNATYRFLTDPKVMFASIISSALLTPFPLFAQLSSSYAYVKIVESRIKYWPPLFFAACNGQLEAAKMLLEAGAETSVDINGTPVNYLFIALQYNQSLFIKDIEEYQANKVKKSQETAALNNELLNQLKKENYDLKHSLEKQQKKCQLLKNNGTDKAKLNMALKTVLLLKDIVRKQEEKIQILEQQKKQPFAKKVNKTRFFKSEKPHSSPQLTVRIGARMNRKT